MSRAAVAFVALALCAARTRVAAAGGSWQLIFSDDFDGPLNTTVWNVYNATSEGSNQVEIYMADNVAVEDGSLVLTMAQQQVTINATTYNFTSGRVDTARKLDFTYGRVEVTAKLQSAEAYGVHSAAWLLGYACWPEGGEIDIQEHEVERRNSSANVTSRVTSNYHFGSACGADDHDHGPITGSFPDAPSGVNPVDFAASFSTYGVTWNATDLVFTVNATVVNHIYVGMPAWPQVTLPTWPMYLILSHALMADRPTQPAPSVWPVRQYIDSVRVWQWSTAWEAPADDV